MTTSTILLPARRSREHSLLLLTSVQQKWLGSFLILHALAHCALGLSAAATGRLWLVPALWEMATVGYLAAGLGMLRVEPLTDWWRVMTLVGAIGSSLLFLVAPHPLYVVGLFVNVIAVALAVYAQTTTSGKAEHSSGLGRRVVTVLALASLSYVALVVGLRPWITHWGTTAAERAMRLPGDDLVPVAPYQLDHAITIKAPAEAIWPWINQIGQERGGFYSYSRLENAVGAHVTNVDRLVPEWGTRKVGELVRGVPADWLGGRLGREIGWRVVQVVPERAMVLAGWGAFVLNPIGPNTTRMQIRTRGPGTRSMRDVLLAPSTVLVFEPAHFIMQRKMLIGIKDRAEWTDLENHLVAR